VTSGETTFIFAAATQRNIGFEFSATTRFHNLPATTTPNTNVFAVNLFVPNANPPPALLLVPPPPRAFPAGAPARPPAKLIGCGAARPARQWRHAPSASQR